MQATIQKWGNSLAVRLPSHVAKETNLKEGSQVEVSVEDGSVVLRAATPRYRLSDLIAQMRPEHRHEEIDFGKAEGKEIW